MDFIQSIVEPCPIYEEILDAYFIGKHSWIVKTNKKQAANIKVVACDVLKNTYEIYNYSIHSELRPNEVVMV